LFFVADGARSIDSNNKAGQRLKHSSWLGQTQGAARSLSQPAVETIHEGGLSCRRAADNLCLQEQTIFREDSLTAANSFPIHAWKLCACESRAVGCSIGVRADGSLAHHAGRSEGRT